MSLNTWVDLSLEYGYCKSNRLDYGHANRCTIVSLMYWLSFVTRPLTLMSMGERMTWKKYCMLVWGRNVVKYAKGREWISKIWLMKKIWKSIYIFGILRTRCFWSMLPSMPKGEIVSMNADAMEEYCKTLILTAFVIDENIVIKMTDWLSSNM